jgi:hypothetical protein
MTVADVKPLAAVQTGLHGSVLSMVVNSLEK